MKAIMAPFRGPKKEPILQGKTCDNPDPRPLGQQWTRLPFHTREKYCHNGGMTFPTSSARRP